MTEQLATHTSWRQMLKALFSCHRDHEVVSRIALLLLFLILFATGISVVYSYYLNKAHDESLGAAHEEMLKHYRHTLQVSVQSMTMSLGETLKAIRDQGGGEPEMESALRRIIPRVHYEDSGYYFVYNTQGVNVVHPFHPEFQGQYRLGVADPEGTHYIAQLTEKSLAGGGFSTYRFFKPGEPVPSSKLVYAQLIPGTEYWVGTGIYLDDIAQELQHISNSFKRIHRKAIITVGTGVAVILVCFVIPVSLVMINSILKPWRQMERELRHAQKMEAIGIFAGGIAHDFGNVIGAISSCTELALFDTDKTSPVYEDLLHVLKAAKRGKSLVKRIKEFSHQADASRQSVDMARMVKECMHLVRSIMPATIQVREHIKAEHVQVMADPDQILQILMNLCTNAEQAMRFVKNGVLTVELDTVELGEVEARRQALKPDLYARLAVSDTGIGMKPVVLKRIFEPFYTTRKKSGGTGLGLSMTKSIVKLYGGGIDVQSVPGKGASFTVLIPCEHHMEELDALENLQDLPGGTESILVVDDDHDLLGSLSKLLRRLGYTVESRSRSKEALTLFKENPQRFDLVFTDQLMPDMTGSEMVYEMRAVQPNLPVILCSGFDGRILQHRIPKDLASSAGFLFFRKPFDSAEICRAIRTLLERESPWPTEATHG
ncbi:cache domain-containing protein [Megalodesulfovibrio gigas]|uniref:cache domain-containing protein n=1 Tax=Megalodesulfovibrio gigas TaxID=879 RepID=UPI0009DBC23A|nr:cache domain-containing protein [Megalodesulfovibrio gigas]